MNGRDFRLLSTLTSSCSEGVLRFSAVVGCGAGRGPVSLSDVQESHRSGRLGVRRIYHATEEQAAQRESLKR
jgi:hypothetical protein